MKQNKAVFSFILDIHLKMLFYFFIGFVTANCLLIYSIIKQIISDKILGISIGFINIFHVMIGVSLVPLVGILLNNTNNYVYATTPVIIITFIAVIFAGLLWRTSSINAKNH